MESLVTVIETERLLLSAYSNEEFPNCIRTHKLLATFHPVCLGGGRVITVNR